MFTGQRSVSSGQKSALHELEAAVKTVPPSTTDPVSGTDVFPVHLVPLEMVQVGMNTTVREL